MTIRLPVGSEKFVDAKNRVERRSFDRGIAVDDFEVGEFLKSQMTLIRQFLSQIKISLDFCASRISMYF